MAYIESIEVVGAKRLILNNITHLRMAFHQIIQLIVGTNGSGKTSLLRELSPLPANPADYTKEGFKSIVIRERGFKYVLTSSFYPKTSHSFLKDGEELNQGGTPTVQKKLVEQEFRYTLEIRDLMQGVEKFSAMTPARRREWLIMLADTDYTYALGVFSRIKARHSETAGALSMTKKRLVQEMANIISKEEESKLRDDLKLIEDELTELQSIRAPIAIPFKTVEESRRKALATIGLSSVTLMRLIRSLPQPYGNREPHKLDSGIDEYKHQITSIETLIKAALAEHAKLDETMQVLKKTGDEGVSVLTDRMEQALSERNRYHSMRKLNINGLNNIKQTQEAFEGAFDSLTDLFTTIPCNEDKRYAQSGYTVLRDKLLHGKDVLSTLKNSLLKLQHEKAKMDVHKTSNTSICPKCDYTWVVGHSEQQYSNVVRLIEENVLASTKHEEEIKVIEETMVQFDEYRKQYGNFVQLVRSLPILNPFWDYLAEYQLVLNAPRKILSIMEVFRYDLSMEHEAAVFQHQVDELKEWIRQSAEIGDANLLDVQTRLEACDDRVGTLTADLAHAKRWVTALINHKKQLTDIITMKVNLEEAIAQGVNLTEEMAETLRRETILKGIQTLQISLAQKAEVLANITNQKTVIDDLERTIIRYTMEETSLKLMVKELSPTDGLIAEGLLQSIKVYMRQMNKTIKKIWSYPLVVQNCGITNERGAELDYKFPMMVDKKDNIVPDISGGSSGQREVIDLAFCMTAAKQLGIADSPLYLDEFAASFDERHRITAMDAIKNIMEQESFSQLFMVSHYVESHGSFTNADVTVLCSQNITLSKNLKYNEHVTFN